MKVSHLKLFNVFVVFVVCFLIFLLILTPAKYIQSFLNGTNVWLTKVVPALFPFLFLTKLLTSFNFVEKISNILSPVTKKLFKTPGISSYVFLMSIISGYPVGAKLISEFFQKGVISQNDATKMNSFCSTSGPFFVIGTCGACLFHSTMAGIIILLSHVFGAIINGVLYRNLKAKQPKQFEQIFVKQKTTDNILSQIMYDCVISILMIGGFIALFFVFIDILNNTKIIYYLSFVLQKIFFFTNLPLDFFTSTLNGIIEVTRGILDLSNLNLPLKTVLPIATFLISFGGMSIHMQSLVFLKSAKIKMSNYFLQKITHSVISMFLCFLFCLFL